MKYRPSRKSGSRIRPETWLLLKQLVIGVLVISVFGLLVWSVYHVTRLPIFTISEIKVDGGETIDFDLVEAAALSALGGSYVGLVPYRFIWFYPESNITDSIRAISRIKEVSLNRDGIILEISFSEYIPFALWCIKSEEECWFVDEVGVAFAIAPVIKGDIFTRYVSLQNSPGLGSVLMSKSELDTVRHYIDRFEDLGWYVRTIEFDAMGDVFFTLNNQSEIKVSLKSSPDMTLRYLNLLLEADKFSTLRTEPFAYIDLRFGTKVYVKEEHDEAELAIEDPVLDLPTDNQSF